jgi:hypothetical protein
MTTTVVASQMRTPLLLEHSQRRSTLLVKVVLVLLTMRFAQPR